MARFQALALPQEPADNRIRFVEGLYFKENELKSEGSAPGAISPQRLWVNSAAGRLAAQRAAEKSLAVRREAPRCGARRKQDGEPCQGLALENGRCRLHGGLTPKGDEWHRVQAPKPGAPLHKADKKMREIARRRRRLQARIAAMTPEERARYQARSRAARPRAPSVRAQERQDRDAAELLARPRAPAPARPEIERLREEMRKLDAEKAHLEVALAGHGGGAEQNNRSAR